MKPFKLPVPLRKKILCLVYGFDFSEFLKNNKSNCTAYTEILGMIFKMIHINKNHVTNLQNKNGFYDFIEANGVDKNLVINCDIFYINPNPNPNQVKYICYSFQDKTVNISDIPIW